MRQALVASGHYTPESTFPEYYPTEVIEDTGGDLPEDAVLDMSGVTWESPETSGIEEWLRLQEAMSSGQVVAVSDDEEEPSPAAEAHDEREWI